MSATDWVHLDILLIKRETEAAFLVSIDGHDEDVWLPKSQIADVEDYDAGDEDVTISVTRWIANEKGLS